MNVVSCVVHEPEQQLQFHFPDGTSATVPLQRISCSTVLQNNLDTVQHAEDKPFKLHVHVEHVRAWIGAAEVLLQDIPAAGALSNCIQAADFLADDAMLQALLSKLAESALCDPSFVGKTMLTPASHPYSPAFQYLAVLESLPGPLAIETLRRSSMSLEYLLGLLSSRAHHLTLHAMFPEILQHNVLSLPNEYVRTWHPFGPSIMALMRSIECLKQLQFLDISHNHITGESVMTLAQSITALSQLKSLNVRDTNMQAYGAVALVQSFTCLGQLQHLDFGDNHISPRGAAALAQSIIFLTQLRYLDVKNTQIGPQNGVVFAQNLTRLVHLQHLDIQENAFRNVGAEALGYSIAFLTNLQHLNVASNAIKAEGSVVLSESLTCLRQLNHLDVAANRLEAEGAVALAFSIASLTKLQFLSVQNCSFGHAGAMALARSLTCLRDLQQLYAQANSFGHEGAVAMVQSLTSLRQLRRLNYDSVTPRTGEDNTEQFLLFIMTFDAPCGADGAYEHSRNNWL